ncbi:zinc-binding dehydrogenase [Actinacidiphila sp. ITFR-21]|uniref:zinc-binding dehydrogenase n=1 Tax=Actinacidiphila sp. ITFR-21 TaxID=3075199 RepID=UPI00288ABD0E|nr:zinc-binding dehydrogenase [Streptomyces sp. ITFR-21]WNI18742.1 zinc-binding dehydrogenase [Streptomyces sp. ITFR-21]
MKAMVRTSFGVQELLDVHVDEPEPDEVLVRVSASGVCHSDLTQLNGGMFGITDEARVLGHEVAGIVERVGSAVTEFAPGDQVVGCLSRSCGHCTQCYEGLGYLCANRAKINRPRPRLSVDGKEVTQSGQLGGFAEMVLTGADTLVKVPHEVPAECAALLGCAVITGAGAILNAARPSVGSAVAVFGVGGVGLNVVQAAALSGARQVVAVDITDDKLELARTFGATHTVNAASGDAGATLRAITDGGVEYAFECAGLASTALDALRAVKPGHGVYLVGVPTAGVTFDIPAGELVLTAKHIHGVSMGANRFKRDIPLLAQMYLQGQLRLDELVADRIELGDVPKAMERFADGGVARSVIVF